MIERRSCRSVARSSATVDHRARSMARAPVAEALLGQNLTRRRAGSPLSIERSGCVLRRHASDSNPAQQASICRPSERPTLSQRCSAPLGEPWVIPARERGDVGRSAFEPDALTCCRCHDGVG